MTAPLDTRAIADIDLSPFSLRENLLGNFLIPCTFLGWFGIVILLANASGFRGPLGDLTFWLAAFGFLAIFLAFIVAVMHRASSSTFGQIYNYVPAGQLGQRPPAFDKTLGEIIQTVDSLRGEGLMDTPVAAEKAQVGASKRARAYRISGILIFLIGMAAINAIVPGGALLALAFSLVIGGTFWMFTRARRIEQPSAELARQHDSRPPILFLRSFQDDKDLVIIQTSVFGIPLREGMRFEEGISFRLADLGPFLSVGEPSEGLPQLGAARAYLAEDQWQEAVRNWINESRLIVMLCGRTHWIHWEMQNIITSNRLNRLLLLLPPGRELPSGAARVRQERWDNIIRSLQDTPYAPALRQLQIDDILLVQFLRDGCVRIFRSANDLVQDYELALTLAIYTALTG